MKKKTTFLQEGSISLSLIGLGILVISAIVLPLASKLVSTRTVSQKKATEQTRLVAQCSADKQNVTFTWPSAGVGTSGVLYKVGLCDRSDPGRYCCDPSSSCVGYPTSTNFTSGTSINLTESLWKAGLLNDWRWDPTHLYNWWVWVYEEGQPTSQVNAPQWFVCNPNPSIGTPYGEINSAVFGTDNKINLSYTYGIVRQNAQYKYGSSCFYRKQNSDGTWPNAWSQFGTSVSGTVNGTDEPLGQLRTCDSDTLPEGTYQVAVGVTSYVDANGNGKYDATDPHRTCSGRADVNTGGADCLSKCLRTLSPGPTATPTLVPPSCGNLRSIPSTEKKIDVEFSFAGKNTTLAKLEAGCFYRLKGSTSDWTVLPVIRPTTDETGVFRTSGNYSGAEIKCATTAGVADGTYEVVGWIRTYYDLTPNGYFDQGEPFTFCAGMPSTTNDTSDCITHCKIEVQIPTTQPATTLTPQATPTVTPRINRPTLVTPSSPSCDRLNVSLAPNQTIKSDFTFSGNGDASAKLAAGIFYRIHDDTDSPGSNWVRMGELYSGTGDANRQAIVRSSDVVQRGITYEVAGSINVFNDTNGNGKYDVGESRDVCSGTVGSSVVENNDCPTKDICFKSIEIPIVTPTVTIAPSACACPTASVPAKTLGNANCDNEIGLADFEIWRQEFLGLRNTKFANFNCGTGSGTDDTVDLADFEIWRRTFVSR